MVRMNTIYQHREKEEPMINNQFNIQNTPLHLAAQKSGSIEGMESLIQRGADLNARNKAGWTPLHIAVAENSYDKAKMLLEAGADVNATIDRQEDDTPLHLVSWTDNVKMAQLLIKHGASLTMYGEDGTPLEAARRNGAKGVEHLIQRELKRREIRRPRVSARGPERIIARRWVSRYRYPCKSRV